MTLLHNSLTGAGPPLVILHGLFGSSKNWQSHARRFSRHFATYCIDLRNHGESFHADEMNYPAMSADLVALLDELGLDTCHLLGHSMGGKVAMTLAHEHPGRIDRLIVADIAPVAYSHDYDDLIDPIMALPLATIESRVQADHLLRPHIPEDPLRAFLMQNLARTEGGWRWRVNWAVIQREMDELTGFDLPTGWRIDTPTLFLRGARSDYVGDIELEVIEAHFTNFELATLGEAGHWLHAEQPDAFIERVLAFLDAEAAQD